VAVLGASVLGLPVSTSHCLVGAMVGVGAAERLCGVDGGGLNFQVLSKIVLGWALTIPLAAALAVLVFLPLRGAFRVL